MAIERRLTELAGPVGGKLHTARSRNDQVATDVAMFTRDAARAARDRRQPPHARARRDVAERHLDWPMPGYTHLQRAQPVYLSPPPARLLLDARRATARASRFVARADRGAAARRRRAGGRELRHRPRDGRRELGFAAGSAPNSIDAVSNRDFVLDYLGAAATCATHLSRLGAELVLWSSEEFGFVEVPDAWASRLVDHAAEEEPRRRRAAAREGAADRRPPERAPRRDARPAADLQQGHAGGQGAPLRRGRHARAVPRGGARDDRRRRASAASGSPRPRPTSSSPRPTSPTCSCKQRRAVPRVPRRRRRARPRRGRLAAARSRS